MSGRSAYVRKKITETRPGEKGLPRSRAKSTTSSDDNATISDFVMPPRQDTGVGTTNARFLKFSEPIRESEALNFRGDTPVYGNNSSGSQSGSSLDGRREAAAAAHFRGPLEDFAYARARRPNIKTEDVSGIEKSGLRSVVDKKSEEVRKGLAKAFTFRRKDKYADQDKALDFRPQSSATVRAHLGGGHSSEGDVGFDSFDAARGHGHAEASWDGGGMGPPPAGRLPPVPQGAAVPPIKRWIGAGRPVQRWAKLQKDPELWDPNGDVLVYFAHKGQQPRPNPSFRLSSHIIEATESRVLITLLRQGSTEEDLHMPPSPAGAPPMLHRHLALGGHGQHLGPPSAYGRGQPTPPISEEASLGEADGQISYEMYFPTPSNMTRIDQLRHLIATRNVFALLYHASLVGLSLYQALSDLHLRLEAYMPADADNIGTIINYLGARGIDDVRNDPEGAVSLLAWSEGPAVRWEEGWRESFLHCAGLYGRLETCADFKNVTPITRALLERASLETQLRVQAAEERLADFQYADMWPPAVATVASTSGPVVASTAKAAADRLQAFFISHYTRVYGRWPPPPPQQSRAEGGAARHGDDDMWLSRTVAQSLQKDFAALYDFLVNRDIVWDGSEARSGRKWMLISEAGNKSFEADTPDVPMTDVIVEFDNRLRFPHIPHPYPLVPDSIPPAAAPAGAKEKPSKKAAAAASNNGGARAGALERRVQLAYTEATNMLVLGSDFTQSDLIDSYSKFEKVDKVGEVDPSTARRGRWVLIYGVLQTLASVSVDAPNIRYREDVGYHLSPRLKGAKMPPWKSGAASGAGGGAGGLPDEAAHELSHCWTVPRAWAAAFAGSSGNDSSAASSGGSGNTSPVHRGAHGFGFPRPPPTVASSTARSSLAGYHTPHGGKARSVRSSSSLGRSMAGGYQLPPLGLGSSASVYSETDTTVSSVRTPGSRGGGGGQQQQQQQQRRRRREPGVGGGYAGSTFEKVDEDWASVAGTGYAASSSGGMGHGRPTTGGGGGGSVAGYTSGGFLVLDDAMDDSRSYATARSGSERDKVVLGMGRAGGGRGNGYGRPLLSRDGSDTDSVAPVIRDFDELDVIDDHEP